jgi:hypothetical protein
VTDLAIPSLPRSAINTETSSAAGPDWYLDYVFNPVLHTETRFIKRSGTTELFPDE